MKNKDAGDALAPLVGLRMGFYGVDACRFKLNKHVFEALEDEDDGWRSFLKNVELFEPKPDEVAPIFFKRAVAMVTVKKTDDGYELVGDDGHQWLRIGTDDLDDYYPVFVFHYQPKAPVTDGD